MLRRCKLSTNTGENGLNTAIRSMKNNAGRPISKSGERSLGYVKLPAAVADELIEALEYYEITAGPLNYLKSNAMILIKHYRRHDSLLLPRRFAIGKEILELPPAGADS